MKKTCILSHIDDLDGCVSALNLYFYCMMRPSAYDFSQKDVYFASYKDSEETLLKLAEEYDVVFIADLSWKDPAVISKLPKDDKFFFFFDHHVDSRETFERMDHEMPNVYVKLDSAGGKCAADLTFDFLLKGLSTNIPVAEDYKDESLIGMLRSFTRYAHSRDLWILDEPLGNLLSEAIVVKGVPHIFYCLVDTIENPFDEDFDQDYNFNPSAEFYTYSDMCAFANEKAIEIAKNTLLSGELRLPDGRSVWLHTLYAFGPVSEIGHQIVEENGLGWAVILNLERTGMSVRTNKETIDLLGIGANNIAGIYQGGGHPQAAGASLSFEQLRDINRVHNEIIGALIQAIPSILKSRGLLDEVKEEA